MIKGRRKKGQKFPQGYIKDQILLNVCEHFPKGIEEPILRDILREEFGIRESKGIKIHLADLEREGLLSKIEQSGKSNLWKIPSEPVFVKALGYEAIPEFIIYAERFMFSEDRERFLESKYARSTLTDDHLDHLAFDFWMNYRKQFLLVVDTLKRLEGEFKGSSTFSPSKTIKKSPTLLSFVLFPEKTVARMAKEFKEQEI